ncbi:MAG: TonB-dependent receptor [Calditrichaeota bacterium]|nr:MAG: TonB-dependent receptor [Calditrichota bacterium]
MSRIFTLTFVVALFLQIGFSETLEPYTNLNGKVLSQNSNSPIPFANVVLLGSKFFTQTDEKGEFSLQVLETGKFTLEISHVSFLTYKEQIEIQEFTEISLNVKLIEASFEVQEILISDSLSEALNFSKPNKILSRQKILDSGAKSVTEILEEIPGVYIQKSSDGTAKLSFRGSGTERVLVLYDGENFQTASSGTDLSTLSLENLERIEIYKGNSSAQFGSGAIGGAINLVPLKKIRKNEIGTSFSAGSFSTFQNRNFVSLKGKIPTYFAFSEGFSKGDFAYTEQVGDGEFRAKRKRNERKQFSGFVSVKKEFTNEFSASVFSDIFYRDKEIPKLVAESEKLLSEEEKNFSGKIELTQKIGQKEFRLGFGSNFLSSDFSQKTNPFYDSKTETQNLFTTFNFQNKKFRIGSKFFAETQTTESKTTFSTIDVFEKRESKRKILSVFGNRKFTFSKFDIFLNGRADKVFDKGKNSSGTFYSAKIQNFYKINEALTFQFSAGKGFRLPEFSSLFLESDFQAEGNENLEPEESFDFEFGAELNFAKSGGIFNSELTFFYSKIDEIIVWRRNLYNRYSPVNDEKAFSRGFETSFSAGFFEQKLKFESSYTYNLATNETDEPNKKGKILPNRPKHQANFGFSVEQLGLRFRSKTQFVSERFETESNQDKVAVHDSGLDNYIKTDFSLSKKYEFSSWNFEVSCFLENAFDEEYANLAFSPSSGRSWRIEVEFRK